MKLTDLEVPVTPACRAALEVATAYCSAALLNHSVRAYLWAAGYALERGIAFDAELLYVSEGYLLERSTGMDISGRRTMRIDSFRIGWYTGAGSARWEGQGARSPGLLRSHRW
jgi:hypothetical protein